MLKKYKWQIIVSTLVILLPIVFGVLMWNKLPEQLPVHWGINGEADGFAGRFFSVIIQPILLFVSHFFLVVFVCLDSKNKGQSALVLNSVFCICPFLSLMLGAMMYSAAFGWNIPTGKITFSFIGILFFVIGWFLPNCKPSRTIGIRLPWLFDRDANWIATHKITGKVWMICGALILATSLFLKGKWMFYALIAYLVVMLLLPIVFSLLYEKRRKNQ